MNPTAQNAQQLMESMTNFLMQQHVLKDKVIEDLQKQVAALQAQIAAKSQD
jgi:hypothetical protein